MIRGLFALVVLGSVGPRAVRAQATVRGVVVGSVGETPIPGARVAARRAGRTATTDGLGRFRLALDPLPDTLVITAIGWRPDTLVVGDQPTAPLRAILDRAPAVVSDLIVAADAGASLDLSAQGRWVMSLEAARSVPPAVETDVYRSLALIPGVSFTSPFSARPMIRGYDAQEVATRIDGFEVLNLYHLGRVFSSFPADAAEQVSVVAAPGAAAEGGSVVGAIEIDGRSGWVDRWHAGGGLSLGSIGAYGGGGGAGLRYFGAVRTLHLKALDLLPDVSFPYHFEDLYGTAVVGPVDRPAGRVTVFASQDRVNSNQRKSLDWYNLMAGTRWRLLDRERTTFEISGSAATFAERGADVPSLYGAPTDFRNTFTRATTTAELDLLSPRSRIGLGVAVGWRQVENRVDPAAESGVTQTPTANTAAGRPEGAAWLDVTHRIGRVALEAGLRADLAGSIVSLEPRLQLQWTLGGRSVLSAAAGRASRLYHLLSDARSEPDLDFFELWFVPNDTVPVAQVDHASLDVRTRLAHRLLLRVSAYLSRGRGIGEVRPESDQRYYPFEFVRFGRSRTRGVEAQLALRGGPDSPHSLSLSYAYAVSERSWGGDWIRWAQDRRHQLRIFGQTRLGRIRLFGALDAATGMPLTPQVASVRSELPGGPLDPAQIPRLGLRVYGAENSVGTSGTFRIDGGATVGFGGPAHDRFIVGVSVINLLFGAVAPISDRGVGTFAVDQNGRPTGYRRLVNVPPIPTLTLRATF